MLSSETQGALTTCSMTRPSASMTDKFRVLQRRWRQIERTLDRVMDMGVDPPESASSPLVDFGVLNDNLIK
jgi:hypothetical protein